MGLDVEEVGSVLALERTVGNQACRRSTPWPNARDLSPNPPAISFADQQSVQKLESAAEPQAGCRDVGRPRYGLGEEVLVGETWVRR
jgi:hypothetical protein